MKSIAGLLVIFGFSALASGDAGMPSGGALPITAKVVIGAEEKSLSFDGVNEVLPDANFVVEIQAQMKDVRLSIVDAIDSVVPSTGTVELGLPTRLTVRSKEPLRPGTQYALKIDGHTGTRPSDSSGGTYSAISIKLLIMGDAVPEPEPPKKKSRKRRR
jgi:hypothetical protein